MPLSFLPLGFSPAPLFLEEPAPVIVKEGNRWLLRKASVRLQAADRGRPAPAWVLFESESRAAVEEQKNNLPALRLSRPLVNLNPLSGRRTLIEDWTGKADAEEAESDIVAILTRFGPAGAQALFASIPVYMAPLNSATGHTAEEPDDSRRFAIYIDPFKATGRLHAASTLVHELSHVERYRRRGFHAHRAVSVMPKEDFILLGAADELTAYQAEAALVTSFLSGVSNDSDRQAAARIMPTPRLRWPVALLILVGFEGPADTQARKTAVRKEILLDLQRKATRYWDFHHNDRLEPDIESAIRNWYARSSEWRAVAAQREDWIEAGARIQPFAP